MMCTISTVKCGISTALKYLNVPNVLLQTPKVSGEDWGVSSPSRVHYRYIYSYFVPIYMQLTICIAIFSLSPECAYTIRSQSWDTSTHNFHTLFCAYASVINETPVTLSRNTVVMTRLHDILVTKYSALKTWLIYVVCGESWMDKQRVCQNKSLMLGQWLCTAMVYCHHCTAYYPYCAVYHPYCTMGTSSLSKTDRGKKLMHRQEWRKERKK